MKRVGQFAVVLAAVASFFAWGTEGFAAKPIRIGYMATLTGEGATWGQHEREGALMAVKDINARGGVLGRPLKLIYYDVKTTTAFKRAASCSAAVRRPSGKSAASGSWRKNSPGCGVKTAGSRFRSDRTTDRKSVV